MIANALATVAAFAAVILAIVVPGALLERLLGLGRSPIERFGLAVALGRVVLGIVGLLLSSLGAMSLVPWLAAAALAAFLAAAWRRPRRRDDPPSELRAALWPIAAAWLLGTAIVFGSGILDANGDLVFRGKDITNDPLFYVSVAAQLAERGLPLYNPLAPSIPMVGHEIHFGALAALRSLGISIAAPFESFAPETTLLVPFAIAFRALPLLDLASLGLAAFALARVLGAPLRSAALAGVLVLLGGEALLVARVLAALVGIAAVDLPTWTSFFGPLLVPVNPIAPAMQILFVAMFLLARLPTGGVVAGITAGLLLGASAEIKVFVQATTIPALVAVAAVLAPAAVRRYARFAAAAALAIMLPSVVQKAVFAMGIRDRLTVEFKACPGCLQRYLLDATFGTKNTGFSIFESYRASDLLSGYFLTYSLMAIVAFFAIAVGARLAAIPQLVRGCSSDVPGHALVNRVFAGTVLFGFAGVLAVGAAPHYLNGSQFAWPALFVLSFELALVVGRWLSSGRLILASGVLALALASPARTLWQMGFHAPILLRVTPDERSLMNTLAESSAPADLVFEPSWLQHADLQALPAWLAGRTVYMSTDSAARYLPTWERLFRYEQLRRVFELSDRKLGLQAIEASGARWVYAPARYPLRFEPGAELEPVASNPAGTLYRYRPEASPGP